MKLEQIRSSANDIGQLIPFGEGPRHIVVIGNSEPRRCGIATFTSDCVTAMRAAFPAMRIDVYAMDDGTSVKYPADIRLIDASDPASYRAAAAAIQDSGADAIWLQHEFGIFGGPAGDMILDLLARTRLPLLTTLHTVLDHPSADEQRVFQAIVDRSRHLMVMARKGRALLLRRYAANPGAVSVIPHGVPDRPYVDPDAAKPALGLSGRTILLTFGLLSAEKGIDNMIRAMPAIVATDPDALYVVLGATHPNLVRREGEALRHSLIALADELGVVDHVAFIDRFVEQDALLDYLEAADVYVTPYNNPDQVTSGTLSYAVAMGKPVVATPYVHATEILADETGVLVPFHDPEALSDAIAMLLRTPHLRADYARRAYASGRSMLWATLAGKVGAIMGEMRGRSLRSPSAGKATAIALPRLDAIARMTDDVGILQHGIHRIADRKHGYCIDDNARALIFAVGLDRASHPEADELLRRYAAFVQHAWNPDKGRFRNFMGYDRRWLEDIGSQDSQGRTLWALGIAGRDAADADDRVWAQMLFDAAIGPLAELTSPRARAFSILGAAARLDSDSGHVPALSLVAAHADALAGLHAHARHAEWDWFEPVLAYDNARLCEAMLAAGQVLGDAAHVATGLSTFAWLDDQQRAPAGHFRPVGSESFGSVHDIPAHFDQQPVEAWATIDAAFAAAAVDDSRNWLEIADRAFAWFEGANDLAQPLIDRNDGGCCDGLTPYGPNRNWGAESQLAYQLSCAAMLKRLQPARDASQPPPERIAQAVA